MKKINRTIISNRNNDFSSSLKELVRYKDLFLTLSWRDFKVKYAQTSLGILWALIQPVITISILHLVFGRFVGVDTGIPHVLFTVAGTSIWSYFSFVMTNSGNSIIASQGMIKKIYFPRLIIPLSKAVVGFIDFGISLILLIVLMIYFRITPSSTIVYSPLFILLGIIAALSVGIWLSALTVRYRDFQHIVPFMVQIGLYITPVAYPAEFATKMLPEWAAKLYYLNPMAGVVQGFRWSVFGVEAPSNLIWISVCMVLILFISGVYYFNKVEKQMADFV